MFNENIFTVYDVVDLTSRDRLKVKYAYATYLPKVIFHSIDFNKPLSNKNSFLLLSALNPSRGS